MSRKRSSPEEFVLNFGRVAGVDGTRHLFGQSAQGRVDPVGCPQCGSVEKVLTQRESLVRIVRIIRPEEPAMKRFSFVCQKKICKTIS